MSQLDIFTIEREEVDKTIDLQWLDPRELTPHPSNPRRGVPAKLEAYTRSMKEEGYRPDKPMLVRPYEDSYQIIGGHSRQQAAINAGLDKVLCCIEHMDDDEAVLRLASDNLNDPFPWYSNALYVVENSVKDSKKGLSRTALVRAATGKEDNAARKEGERLSAGGEVIQHLEQCVHVDTLLNDLLDPETNYLRHLSLIHKAPQREWQWLTSELLKNSWTVRDTEAASKAISQLCSIPEHFQAWLKPEQWKKKAISEDRVIRDLSNWVTEAQRHYETFEDDRTTWEFNGGVPSPVTVNTRSLFIDALTNLKSNSNIAIQKAALRITQQLDDAKARKERWELEQQDKNKARDEAERRQKELLKKNIEFAPVGINADLLDAEIPEGTFDLVLTDPPYLLSNDGITCRGNSQVSVDKNFEDTAGEAISPDEWLPICLSALKPGGVLVFTCTTHLDISRTLLEGHGFEVLEDLVWLKRSAPPRLTPTGHRACHEQVWVCRKPGESHHFSYELLTKKYWQGKQPSSYLEFEQCSGKERLGWHDTQKPLKLWRYFLEAYCPDDGQVLDPFAGSATTAVAAKGLGIKCTWVEKKEDFFERSQSRIDETLFPWEKN